MIDCYIVAYCIISTIDFNHCNKYIILFYLICHITHMFISELKRERQTEELYSQPSHTSDVQYGGV